MRFMLPSRFVGTFTAAVLTMTTFTAAPAYADRDDSAARTVAAILGLAVVGAIIHENRQDKKHDKKVYREPTRVNTGIQRHRHGSKVHRHGNARHAHNHGVTQPRQRVAPKPLPQRVNRKLLPQQCFRSFNSRNGKVRMFGRRCLEQNYRFVDRLPQNCVQRVRTRDGKRVGYGARCLQQNGYRLARQ